MELHETFQAVAPGVVAFAQSCVFSPDGTQPLAPTIFGTGFVVDPVGIIATNRHIIEVIQNEVPTDPRTGKKAVLVIYFHYSKTEEGKAYVRWVLLDVKYHTSVQSFQSAREWYGEPLPDIALVQVEVRDLCSLQLATEDYYLRVGMPIATVGFPMGDASMTVMRKLHQMTPFLRSGIVSSVFPFPIPQPHGFTIDITQQGGSSGSPIFRVDAPIVVGMMAASLIDYYEMDVAGHRALIPQNTNISRCITSRQISDCLIAFKTQYPPKVNELQPLAEYLRAIPMVPEMSWQIL